MRRAILPLLFALALSAQDSRPNFSGVWRVNQLRSTGREEAEAIDHKGASCTVQFYYLQADFVPSKTYIIDGKDRDNLHWITNAHWEAGTLVIDDQNMKAAKEYKIHITMALSADGKVLTKTVHYSPPGVDRDVTMVFDRISTHVAMGSFGVGASMADVKSVWGEPDQVVESGTQTAFIYRNWQCGRMRTCSHRLIFIDGKFTESRYTL